MLHIKGGRRMARIRTEYAGRGLPLSQAQEEARNEALKALVELPGFVELWKQVEDFYVAHDDAPAEAWEEAYYNGVRDALEFLCDAAVASSTGFTFETVRNAEISYFVED